MSLKDLLENATANSELKSLYSDFDWEYERNLTVISIEIRLARIDRGMSEKEFARFMNVTRRTYRRWESGTHNFTIKELSMIATKLGRMAVSFIYPQYIRSAYERI